jgi:hypothetical protein
MVGAGVSGQLALVPSSTAGASANQGSLQDLVIAPGVAPWVSGRAGIPGDNEGGLTYSGHDLRVDVRHAFNLSRSLAISLGLGASAVIAQRPEDTSASGVYGGGADIPLLIGVRSVNDVFAFWFGPRGGFDILSGGLQLGEGAPEFDVSARHFYAGLTTGMRVGFRHVHVALEINAAYHYVDGTFRPSAPATASMPAAPATSAGLHQVSLTPAGAVEVTF